MPRLEDGFFSTVTASEAQNGPQESSFQGAESFFRSVLKSMEAVYLDRNPTAKSIVELIRSIDGDHMHYDHVTFMTLGVKGLAMDSMPKFFLDFGYVQQEELRFPAKKLKAYWFSPPRTESSGNGDGVDGPLPRIFIAELQVDELSPQAQEIIRKYTDTSGNGSKHAAHASALGSSIWGKPSYTDFQQPARESDYAAWILVHGYAINHIAISTHQLESHLRSIKSLNQFLEDHGYIFNSEEGLLKVSPDGLLLQSSVLADVGPFQFLDGTTESVPFSFIEFVERLVLPKYKDLPEKEVKELHRRDGFEVGNAYKLMESTSKHQRARRAAA